MSKFEMSAPVKRRGANVVPCKSETSGTPAKTGKSSELLSQKNITSVLEIAKIVVQGQAEIAKIRASSEAEIQRVEADIKRIIASTQSDIAKMHEENANWHSKFEARQQAIANTLKVLDSHPEYSDEVKKAIIQLTISGMEG